MTKQRQTVLLFTVLLCLGSGLLTAPCSATAGGFNGDTMALVRRTAANEARANAERAAHSRSPVQFRLYKQDEKGVTTKEIVQTRDGSVARLLAVDNHPLTPEQEEAEVARLQRLLDRPELQERRRKREKEDAERANKMVQIMPDAFIYTYDGMSSGPNGPVIKLRFKPNPTFVPPDQESRIDAGIEGEIWIDQAQERLVRLDAHLFQDVDFGWGIVGKLYKGGTVHIDNADIGNHTWALVHMKLDLVGRALMMKTLTFKITEDASDFQPVAKEMGYEEAIRMLQSKDKQQSQVARQ